MYNKDTLKYSVTHEFNECWIRIGHEIACEMDMAINNIQFI